MVLLHRLDGGWVLAESGLLLEQVLLLGLFVSQLHLPFLLLKSIKCTNQFRS
jgi:hypothetical protein